MYFDIVFLVSDSNKYFDRNTLEKNALGGMEASVVRIAEGLGSLGLSVAVVQGGVKSFETTMGQFCFFLHSDNMVDIECKHFIQVRNNNNSHLFPDSKRYIWLHNTIKEDAKTWDLKKDVTLLGVSRWHRNHIKEAFPLHENIKYIYNPVPEDIYVNLETEIKYEPNLLVWASSPHKGLGKAIEVFKKIRKKNDRMNLVILNPGYFNIDSVSLSAMSGLSVYGSLPARQAWSVIQKALCVLYPTDYPETMCLVAAESNAVGTPIATYRYGALKEVVSSDNQMVEPGDELGLVSKIIDWSKNGRPKVFGRDEFKFSNVILEWCKILAENLIVKI